MIWRFHFALFLPADEEAVADVTALYPEQYVRYARD